MSCMAKQNFCAIKKIMGVLCDIPVFCQSFVIMWGDWQSFRESTIWSDWILLASGREKRRGLGGKAGNTEIPVYSFQSGYGDTPVNYLQCGNACIRSFPLLPVSRNVNKHPICRTFDVCWVKSCITNGSFLWIMVRTT